MKSRRKPLILRRNAPRIEVPNRYKSDMKIAFEASGTDLFPGESPGCLQRAFLEILGASSKLFWRARVLPGDPLRDLCLPSGCSCLPPARFLKLLAPCPTALLCEQALARDEEDRGLLQATLPTEGPSRGGRARYIYVPIYICT